MRLATRLADVQRRRLLAAVGSAAGLAGCVGRGETPAQRTETPPLAARGEPADLCDRPVVDLGIAAITGPAFADGGLDDEQVVIGVDRGGAARAYPLSVLSRAEVVNDVLPDGTPILVTYCPVCDSGMVAERRVDGAATTFGVSGLVWQPPGADLRASEREGRTFGTNETAPEREGVRRDGALVLYDAATGSYWSQVLARAVCGPARGTGLTVLPATTARWRDWRADHPDSAVLLPFPESGAGNPPIDGARTSTPRPPE
jgi:hypothetical protein